MGNESIPTDLSAEEFIRFRDYIHEHSGIYLEQNKADSLRISLVARATRYGMCDLVDYFKLLIGDETEFRELLDLITINETSFFRFPAQFKALREIVIPEICAAKSARSRMFRVWCAGCSTGEEPYTVAMTILDSGIKEMGFVTDVMGTDVSSSALAKARTAWYPARAFTSVPRDIVERHFESTDAGFSVAHPVRRIVNFSYHNLIKEPYPVALMGNWDVIFCRNVTIYFRLESTRRVVENFYKSLNPGGYLFIGHSETLTGITDRFEPVETEGVFLYRKPMGKTVTAAGLAPRASRVARPGVTQRVARPAPPEPSAPLSQTGGSVLDELLVKARAASAGGRAHDALALARQAIELAPGCVDGYLLAGFAHADAGDFPAALEMVSQALAIDPLHASARYVLGMIYMRTDRLDEAMLEFKRTIYADSEFVLAHLNLGNLYRARGATDDACREYENALKSLARSPDGAWRVFLAGFRTDLLAQSCERSLIECRKVAERSQVQSRRRR